jgi:hypothetical protein
MTDPRLDALGPGDLAPDFTLPAANVEGNMTLSEYLRRGPVFLTMLRGLYCPFCRRRDRSVRDAPRDKVVRLSSGEQRPHALQAEVRLGVGQGDSSLRGRISSCWLPGLGSNQRLPD